MGIDIKPGYHPDEETSGEKDSLKNQGFYKTAAWKRLRLLVLQRDHYICQLRTSKYCTGIATEVHHIKELEDYPELGLDMDNLTSVCWWCHETTKKRKGRRVMVRSEPKAVDAPAGVRVIRVSGSGDCECGRR